MPLSLARRFSYLCVLSLLIAGCGEGGGVDVETHPAKGTVKFDDGSEFPASVMVTLTPVDGEHHPSGATQSGGTFVLKTGDKDGAPVGKFKVSFGLGGTDEDPAGALAGGLDMTNPPFDQKYFSPNDSDLTVEIKSGPNDLTITVPKKKGGAKP